MKNLTANRIRKILKKKWPKLKYVWLFNSNYTAIDIETFKDVILNLQPIEQKFDSKKFDCDKFALVTQALVSLVTAKDSSIDYDIAFGQIVIKHKISKEIHAINVLIDSNEKIHLMEPQGRHFVDGVNMKPLFLRI